jgi:glutathione reductase (NADPH)
LTIPQSRSEIDMHDFDLFVIGGGSGGVRAARIAALHGAKVGIAEEYRVGGTCVIRGCIPKKLFVYASQFADEFKDAAGFGWSLPAPRFSWPALIAAKDKEIARLEGFYVRNLEKAGVKSFGLRAVIEGPHTVRLGDGTRLTARVLLIATGAAPFRPSFPGSEHTITSNEAFHLEELPKRITLVGGGYIAAEFAGIFNGLGAHVRLSYRGPRILRGFDEDLRLGLEAEMGKKGVEVATNEDIERITRTPSGLVVETKAGARLETDLVMMATGRTPNTGGLGLEKADVKLAPSGAVMVDTFSRSNVENIYAIGDVTDRLNLTPVAIREGHAFADSVFGGRPTEVDHANVPTAVFSQPAIGSVGLTEEAAREKFGAVDIYRSSFRPLKATLSGRQERVMMKLVVDVKSDVVVGCHMLGAEAPELAQCLAIAVKAGATKADFDATLALHPTAAEELVLMREKVPPH